MASFHFLDIIAKPFKERPVSEFTVDFGKEKHILKLLFIFHLYLYDNAKEKTIETCLYVRGSPT